MTNTLMSLRTHTVKQQVSASDSDEVALELMTIGDLALPKFFKSQVVCFVSGVGTVKRFRRSCWGFQSV